MYTNLLVGVDLKHRQLARQIGAFARLDVVTRLRMASHGISWVLGAHMCYGSLDFVVTTEGELVRALAPKILLPPAST
jgi:hypothetical protein